MRDHTNKTTYSGTVGTGKSYGTLTTGTGDAIGKVSDLNVTGEATIPGVRLWGHRINLAADDGIKCEECEMQEELPELMQMTNGFREVIYKMYVLGKFRQETCQPTFESDNSILHKDDIIPPMDSHRRYPEKDYIPQGSIHRIGGGQYEYARNNEWFVHKTDGNHRVGDIITTEELISTTSPNTVAKQLGPQVVNGVKERKEKQASHQIGDMQMMVGPDMHDDLRQDAGMSVDKSATTNITADLKDSDVDESMKEKFARKLCEKTGL